jgi:hypothetical protein
MAVITGLVLAAALLPQDGNTQGAESDPSVLGQEIERQQRELDELRRRLDEVEAASVGAPEKSLLDVLRINVYSNILGQTDDQLVLDEDGREVQDRVRVRKTDFDFRAPLGRSADAVVIATLESDPVSDYDGSLEEGYARLRLFEDDPWPVQLLGGQFRSRFGRNNRLRVFELPQPTRPLVVTEFLGDDGTLATGGAILVGIPTGSEHHTVTITYEGTNSGDPRFADDPGEEPIASMVNLDWAWTVSPTFSVLTGLSGYSSRGNHDRLGGADVLLSWNTEGPAPRAYHLGAEVMKAKPDVGDDASGGYAWGQVQLAENWFLGGRYDYLERLSDSDLEVNQGGLFLSWLFTKHLRFSAGYEHSTGDQDFVDGANHVYGEANVFLGADPLVPFWAGRNR